MSIFGKKEKPEINLKTSRLSIFQFQDLLIFLA